MPKYLYWRGNSLWCRYPLPGYPRLFPLGIKSSGTVTDRRRAEAEGERVLASLRTKAAENRFFDIVEPEVPYNPKYWRIAGRYLVNSLLKTKTGRKESYHLLASIRKFGKRYAKEITRKEIEKWLEDERKHKAANTVNNYFTNIRAAYRHANNEEGRLCLNYDPTKGMEKGQGSVRRFVLTAEKFERNYAYLKARNPRFALFYLALWETGRRPEEVSFYTWDMVQEMVIDGERVPYISVPPEITKTGDYGVVAISPRLYREITALGYRHGYIFRNALGDRWQNWEHHQGKLRGAFGDDAGVIRDCRRGFVTHKTEVEGFDPFHVRQATGHKTNAVFERYRIGSLRNIRAVVCGGRKDTNCIQSVDRRAENGRN